MKKPKQKNLCVYTTASGHTIYAILQDDGREFVRVDSPADSNGKVARIDTPFLRAGTAGQCAVEIYNDMGE